MKEKISVIIRILRGPLRFGKTRCSNNSRLKSQAGKKNCDTGILDVVQELFIDCCGGHPGIMIMEEQNYNMIDGRMNNLPLKPRKIGERISVLDRLHLKRAEIARRSGKAVP